MIWPPLPQPHQRFIHRDAHQPGIKSRAALEIPQMPERFQKSILHRVFRVGVILRDVLRHAENFALVAIHQFFERRLVPALGSGNELRLVFAHNRRG